MAGGSIGAGLPDAWLRSRFKTPPTRENPGKTGGRSANLAVLKRLLRGHRVVQANLDTTLVSGWVVLDVQQSVELGQFKNLVDLRLKITKDEATTARRERPVKCDQRSQRFAADVFDSTKAQ